MTNEKRKTSEVEDRVKSISNGAHIYLPKDWIGKKVKTVIISSLVVLILVTLMTSQTVAIAKKQQQPKQAVDNPSAGKSNDDQPTSTPTNDDNSKDKANSDKEGATVDFDNGDKKCQPDHTDCKKPDITCSPGFKVKHGVCNKDIFINVHKASSSNAETSTPTYITGTLVDCNVVFATPNYFSTLAIKLCNQQYGAK